MKRKPYKQKKDWFRPKSYPHIGLPLSFKDRDWVSKYVKNPEKIASHAFLPFIYRRIDKRKFRKEISEIGERSEKRHKESKTRHIYYASHLDSQIYSYYAELLKKEYEKKLGLLGLKDSITAYRRIPIKSEDRNKCNIDFAKEVFDFIKNSGEKSLIAVAFDIKSFFDSLSHKLLKKTWYELLGRKNLKKDHFNVFKSLTDYSYINENQIFNEFKNEIIAETKNGKRVKKRIKRRQYLFDNDAIAYCTKKQFDERLRKNGLVFRATYDLDPKTGKKTTMRRVKGIPQGTPLSAILANIYMIDFDHKINQEVQNIGGLYRRYSDDMVIICKPEFTSDLESVLMKAISEVKLEIQPGKTKIFKFDKVRNEYNCLEWLKESRTWYPYTNFEYLGFSFDGKKILIKPSSVANYYRKMKRNVWRGACFAEYGNNKDGQIYRRKLYKKFSHLGSGRRLIYKRDKHDSKKWIKTYKYDWGNFLSYVKLAEVIMEEPAIGNQFRRHWRVLNDEIKIKRQKVRL